MAARVSQNTKMEGKKLENQFFNHQRFEATSVHLELVYVDWQTSKSRWPRLATEKRVKVFLFTQKG